MMIKTIAARGASTGVAALLVAGVLCVSSAPAAAVGMPPKPAPAASPQMSNVEMMALAERPLEQATAYCESRYRSYDRATGTFLGFDGSTHVCP